MKAAIFIIIILVLLDTMLFLACFEIEKDQEEREDDE